VPLFRLLIRGDRLDSISGIKFCHEILDTLGYHRVKLEVFISPGLESVPGRDRQTDRRTDRITVANTR